MKFIGRVLSAITLGAVFSAILGLTTVDARTTFNPQLASTTHHNYADIDGVYVFYREAGPKHGPVVLLLQGFPTSSQQFRNLIPALSDRYHVIAPD